MNCDVLEVVEVLARVVVVDVMALVRVADLDVLASVVVVVVDVSLHLHCKVWKQSARRTMRRGCHNPSYALTTNQNKNNFLTQSTHRLDISQLRT